MCQDALEHGQKLRVYREQLQKTVQELQEAHTCCESLKRQIDEVTQQAHQKVKCFRVSVSVYMHILKPMCGHVNSLKQFSLEEEIYCTLCILKCILKMYYLVQLKEKWCSRTNFKHERRHKKTIILIRILNNIKRAKFLMSCWVNEH